MSEKLVGRKRKIPERVYLSADRQWAVNKTPICTEEYVRESEGVVVCARYDEERRLVIAIPAAEEPTFDDPTCGLGKDSGWICRLIRIQDEA